MKLVCFHFSAPIIHAYRYIVFYIKKYHFKSMIYKIVKKIVIKLSNFCQTCYNLRKTS